ncbi:MAG TPA: hypothetical protein VFM56_10575, partial [Solimonas sp.]|nr:hypothetical protein [Solimonas sp.]
DRLAQGAVDIDPPPLDAESEPEKPEPELPPTKVLVQMVLSPGLALLAPNWNVSRSEVEQLSECYAAVIDKYFPNGMGNFGPEIAATVITLAVFGPRLNTPRKVEEKKTDETAAADAGAH